MIYLDNAGTTKMFDECLEVHRIFSVENFYNPSAMSKQSLEVSKILQETEQFFLNKLGAKEGNVVFTGCATESNNLAIRGSVRKGDYEYVFSAGEHPSVFNVAKKMEQEGFKVLFVPLDKTGRVDLKELEKVLNEKTRLVSIISVSNETGAINDMQEISKLKNRLCPKAILHMDGVQAFMKIPVTLKNSSVDLFSFSAHKICGPKGIAGLYVKNKNALKPIFEGGGQQYSLRSGTENVSGIMQFRKAVELVDINKNFERVSNLKKVFNEALKDVEILNFDGSPYIEILIFKNVKGETMLHALNEAGVIVGLGSACSSKKAGNRILSEIGILPEDIISSVRISFNPYQTEEEIIEATNIINKTYQNLKERMMV